MRTTSILAVVFAARVFAATNCTGATTVQCHAVSETTQSGTKQNDYTKTFVQDGAYEILTERDSGGAVKKRYDLLQHTWQFDVASGTGYTLFLQAYRTDAGNDGDNFTFAFSTDGGQTWTNMVTINQATAAPYQYTFAGSAAGALRIRATDTNRTAGLRNHASLYVDRLYVQLTAPPPPPPPAAKRVIGYFTSWSIYARNYLVSNIPAGQITHINYAFANLQSDGRVVLGDSYADSNNFQQLATLKSQYPNVKTLISIGGWTWSNHFSNVFANSATRQTFCASLLDFANRYGFDGADIDWEYPGSPGEGDNSYRPGGVDGQNYITTMQLCRPMFTQANKLLTAATSCNPQTYENEMNLGGLTPYLDWYNLMNYDLHGAWDSITHHHSQLYRNLGDPEASNPVKSRFNGNACVSGYLNQGVPAGKLVLGLPFYARSYARVNPASGGNPAILGLFQSFSGVPPGTWDNSGVRDYQDIVQNLLPIGARAYDDAAAVPTLTWNTSGQGMAFASYDDRTSTCNKAAYALNNGLGGLMFWEFSADIENHPESLVRASYCGLNPGAAGCAGTCP
jgi:chitinase